MVTNRQFKEKEGKKAKTNNRLNKITLSIMLVENSHEIKLRTKLQSSLETAHNPKYHFIKNTGNLNNKNHDTLAWLQRRNQISILKCLNWRALESLLTAWNSLANLDERR